MQKSGHQVLWGATWLLLLALYLGNFLHYHRWQTMVTEGGDSWGYYTYLPAACIYHDLKDLQSVIRIREEMHPGTTFEENGLRRVGEAPAFHDRNVIKYTYGVALMHAPAFFVAHLYTLLTDKQNANGYSRPYILALYLSTLGYIFLGLILLGNVLRRYFSEKTSMITVLLIGLATNLFYFGVINNVMAHPLLFFLWAALIYCSDRYHRTHAALDAMFIGGCLGLIVVIRPVEIMGVLVPVFWGLKGFNEVSGRLKELWLSYHRDMFYAIVTGGMIIFPQLAYWKLETGHWLFYSYPGEHFDFGNPHVWSGLVGFANGWLPYTPVMVFGLAGFYFFWKRMAWNAGLFFLIMALHVYITYSWWNWYYINGFGSRPMVDTYAVMAFPLAAFAGAVISTRWRWVILPVWVMMAVLNIFQMYQVDKGVVESSLMNRAYYFESFGKTEFTQPMNVALDLMNYQYADIRPDHLIATYDFESGNNPHLTTARAAGGDRSYLINTGNPDDAQMQFSLHFDSLDIQQLRKAYLMVHVNVYVERQISGFYDYDTMVFDVMRGDKIMRRRYLRLNNKPGDVGQNSIWWGEIHRWYPVVANMALPGNLEQGDYIIVHPQNVQRNSVVYIDDLQFSIASRQQ